MLPEEIADARQRRYNGTVAWLRKPHPDLMMIRVQAGLPASRRTRPGSTARSAWATGNRAPRAARTRT